MTDPGGGHGDPGGGLGGGLGGNDLEQPPAYVEGSGGGPAMPTGGISQAEKELNDEMSKINDGITDALLAGAALSLLGEPEDTALPGVLGLMSAAFALFGDLMDAISEDPPQPSYARPVVFKQRISNPLQVVDSALEPLRVCIQQALFGSVTAQGYLDSIERLQGAQLAGDITWALVHRGVANLALEQYILDIANNGAALYAAGNALKGSNYDFELKTGTGGVKKWINTRGTKASLTVAMQASGFTPAEIKKTFTYFNTDPEYTGPTSTLSTLLIEAGQKIYDVAEKMSGLT
jgi:hypothetical protein